MDATSPTPPAPPVSRLPRRPPPADAVGSLGKAFGIWTRSFVPVSVIVLVVNIPVFGLEVLVHRGMIRMPGQGLNELPVDLLGMVLGSVSTGAVTYGVIQRLCGRPVGAGASISMGLSRVLPVLGTSLLVALTLLAGFVALFVPFVILACGLSVAIPAAVVENTSGASAMRRSWDLTRGAKGSIFLAYLLFFVVGAILAFAVVLGIGDDTLGAKLAGRAIELGIQAGLSAVFGAVLYHDLRVAKEGASVEDIARVFD